MTKRRRPIAREAAVPADATLEGLLVRLHEQFPGLRAEAVRSGLAVAEFSTRVLAAIDAHFGRYGLSQVRFTVLMMLVHYADRPWTPAGLADAVRVSRATMTTVLQVLERDGWLERQPDPADGRKIRLRITTAGRRRFLRIMRDHFNRVITAFAAIDSHDYKTFREEQEKMLAAFEALAAGARES